MFLGEGGPELFHNLMAVSDLPRKMRVYKHTVVLRISEFMDPLEYSGSIPAVAT